MTKDNKDKRNDMGEPGPNIQPADVIKCRECGGMVRRLNSQHLQADRCRYTDQDQFHREDKKRPDHPETVEDYKEKYPGAPIMSPREKMNLVEANKDDEVDDRRRSLLKRRWRGESMSRIIEDLAKKHDVTENAIWRDWSKRDKWIGRVFGLEDAEAVVVESLAQKQDVRERLLRVARQAEDENEINAAIRALKAVDDNIDETIEHQQNLGNVDQASSKHEVHVEGQVDHQHEQVGSNLDENQLEAIDAITGGGGEDIIDAEYYEVEEGEEADND